VTETERYRSVARKIVYQNRIKELIQDFRVAEDRAPLFAHNDMLDGRLKDRVEDLVRAMRNSRRRSVA
jgi:hypothetical protein